MKSIHISEIYRRNNIEKTGLHPSTIQLSHHLERFKEQGFLNDNEDKMLYMWLDSEKNEKFIKDMMYCKMWLGPRNKLSTDSYENKNEIIDWSKQSMKGLYPYSDMIYDIYEVSNAKMINNFNNNHVQEPDDSQASTTFGMDAYYAHDDKILVLSKESENNVKRVGQAKIWKDKKGKIKTQIFKNIRY